MGKTADKKIRSFLKKLRANFEPENVILFGSRAKNEHLKHSDYDFLIVSKKFEGIDFLDRIPLVIRKCNAFFAADFLCYTPEEFERKKKEIGIVRTALKEGISV